MSPGFVSLMRRAEALRRLTSDHLEGEWWAGYMRGLRRAHHGAAFGTDAEHRQWLAAAQTADTHRAARGRGYAAGLQMLLAEPPDYEAGVPQP